MANKPYDSLVISSQKRFTKAQKEQRRQPPRSCTGWDTETFEGRCHLLGIADALGGELYHTIPLYPDDEEGEADKLFSFITNIKRRSGKGGVKADINLFYNLDYDARALIKWIPSDLWDDLRRSRPVKYLDYTFNYLPSKLFSITKDGRKTTFFDLAQFYGKSLDYNARKYLGMAKLEGISGSEIGTQPGIWFNRLDDIIEYCLMDCKILARLGDNFNNMLYKTLNFSTKKFYSTGSLAQEYYLTQGYIPQLDNIPPEVLKMAWNSYRGGRIEILQRGTFKSIYEVDIKSAYPAKMTELLDYSNGQWEQIKTGDYTEDVDAGIYRIKASWNYPKIAPFPRYVEGTETLCYPIQLVGTYDEYLVNEKELRFLDKHPDKCDYEILDGWEFFPFKYHYPFKDVVERLFQLKEEEEDPMKKLIYKLLLNSAYGKTAQALLIDEESPIKRYETGRLWNPIYASRITSLTRLQLLEAALPMMDSVIGFATDAIHTSRRPRIKTSDKLGGFELTGKGEPGLVLMAGIRQIGNNYKVRGASMSGETTLLELARQNRDGLEIPAAFTKPMPIFKALQSKRPELMNQFIDEPKRIHVNGDYRRLWDKDFISVGEALETSMGSLALPSHL